MSLRDDAHLSAQERAALNHLEALAAAEDPHLAAKLRGRRPVIAVRRPHLPRLELPPWCGPVLVLAGLAMMMFSLSVRLGLLLGIAGAATVGTGVWLITRWLPERLSHRTPEAGQKPM